MTLLPVSATPYTNFRRPQLGEHALGHEFDQGLSAAGVSIVRVPQHPVSWVLDGLAVRRHIRALIAQGPLDAVLGYYHESAFLPGVLRKEGIRFGFIAAWQSYAIALNAGTRGFWNRRLRRLRDHALIRSPHTQADILFPISEFTRSELVSVLGIERDRMRVCYFGVDPAFLSIPRTPRQQVRTLVFFGRLVRLKGVRDALSALGKLKQAGVTGWRFRMMGDGDRAWVERLAVRFGIHEHVDVLPAVGDSALRRELADADLALMPSHAESFGLSIAEAQASGIPVVAYAAGSVPEVVANGETGWLVPLGDIDALAEALADALGDAAECRRRGEAARSRVARLFNWESAARTITAGLEAL